MLPRFPVPVRAVPGSLRMNCVHQDWFPYVRNGKTAYSGVIFLSNSSAVGKKLISLYSSQVRSRSRMKSTRGYQDIFSNGCSTVLSVRNRFPKSASEVYPFSSDSLESHPYRSSSSFGLIHTGMIMILNPSLSRCIPSEHPQFPSFFRHSQLSVLPLLSVFPGFRPFLIR